MLQECENQTEVIIIGAGPAGLGAASILQKQNIPYTILQARLRVGGRAHSIEIDDVRVDLGAWWLHSFNQNNAIKKYVDKFGIELFPNIMDRVLYDGQKCQKFSEQTIKNAQKYHDQFFALSQEVGKSVQDDISVKDATNQKFAQKWSSMTQEQRRCTQLLISITQRHQSSSIGELSAKNFYFIKQIIKNQRPKTGYAHIFRKISEGLNIQLNRRVVSIDTSRQKIKVQCSNGFIYVCNKILVSLPLGVLKQKKVKFIPNLPQRHSKAIERLGFGLMNKIYLSFNKQFWGEGDWISIGFDKQGVFPHFFNYSTKDRFILACFISDNFARHYEGKDKGQIVQQLVNILKKVFKCEDAQLRQAYVTNWGQDQFAFGSYTAFHVGSSPEDSFALRQNIDNKMWFIGEHCYAEHIGTAHGALQTGEWAAQQVIKMFK